ncbi:hypothetical protein EAI_11899 [Harpegnathos saltator]|uniref:Uncharacterized protein n=1 Tax=Harpegnathos saltator TaxID=610380 RepID=E2BTW7_HARSA|nr:hypothetical protein EAI_11899 [Harpegnathos saltator]
MRILIGSFPYRVLCLYIQQITALRHIGLGQMTKELEELVKLLVIVLPNISSCCFNASDLQFCRDAAQLRSERSQDLTFRTWVTATLSRSKRQTNVSTENYVHLVHPRDASRMKDAEIKIGSSTEDSRIFRSDKDNVWSSNFGIRRHVQRNSHVIPIHDGRQIVPYAGPNSGGASEIDLLIFGNFKIIKLTKIRALLQQNILETE